MPADDTNSVTRVEVMLAAADRITVLYYGEILATGTPEEIQNSTRVREVYLGEGH